MKKQAMLALLSLSLSLTFSTTSLAGEWKKDQKGWWYSHEDGSYPTAAWSQINGHWYYFDNIGYMVENTWIGDYYLGKDGAMLTDTVTPDGYTVDADGKWISGIARVQRSTGTGTVRRSSGGSYSSGSSSSGGGSYSGGSSSGGGSYSGGSSSGSTSGSGSNAGNNTLNGGSNTSGNTSGSSSGSSSANSERDVQIASLVSQGLTAKEAELYLLINDYRVTHGLPRLSLSKSLMRVAQVHVWDSNTNTPEEQYTADGRKGNLHSWSYAGSWQGVVYTPDHEFAALMWSKPGEITNYTGSGYEISVWSSGNVSPQAALRSWESSPAHNGVILGENYWSRLKTMGVGIDGSYAHVWFGETADPDGYFDIDNYEVVYP